MSEHTTYYTTAITVHRIIHFIILEGVRFNDGTAYKAYCAVWLSACIENFCNTSGYFSGIPFVNIHIRDELSAA